MTSLHKIFSELERIEEESLSIIAKKKQFEVKIESLRRKIRELEEKKREKEKEKFELELRIRNFELSIKEEEEKIKKWEAQLRESSRFKEQMTLLAEISDAKKEKARLEDEVLKLIIKKDEVEEEVKKIGSELSEIKEEAEKRIGEWGNEISDLERRKAELDALKERILENLKNFYSDIYRVYIEFSRDSRVGKPIARVENSTCMSCNMVVLPDVEARLYSDPNSCEICTNCGAILYIYFEEYEDSVGA